jgi:hypothetical protein
MINASNPGIDEKMPVINQKAVSASETDTGPTTSPTLSDSDLDDAFKYLHDHDNAFAESTNVNLAALRRKIDWRIVPIMFVCYVLQFVDKVVINVSWNSPALNGIILTISLHSMQLLWELTRTWP